MGAALTALLADSKEQPVRAALRAYGAYFSCSLFYHWVLVPVRGSLRCSFTIKQLSPHSPSLFWGSFRERFIDNGHRMHDWTVDRLEGRKTCAISMPLYESTPLQIVTIDEANIKHMLQDNFNNYVKMNPVTKDFPKILPGIGLFIGHGIFSIDHGPHAVDGGQKWKFQRKLAATIFTKKNFTNYMGDGFRAKSNLTCEYLERKGANGGVVDLQDVFFRFTMETIGKLFFGVEFGLLSAAAPADGNSFGASFDTAHDAAMDMRGPASLAYSLTDRVPAPLNHMIEFLFWRGGKAQHLVKSCKELRQHCKNLIDECRSDPSLPQRKDLMANFLNHRDEAGQPLSGEDLIDLAISFVIAGRDTTACLLSWACYLLARDQAMQTKLREAIKTEWDGRSEIPLELEKLPYLKGVLYEALRLYAVVPIDGKSAVRKDTLPDGTVVPAGARTLFFPYGIGRDPARWGPDVLEARPERWIGKPMPSFFDFPMFQAGPRICLGMNFAMLEASVMLAALVARFKLTLDRPDAEVTYKTNLTMSIKGGLPVRLEAI